MISNYHQIKIVMVFVFFVKLSHAWHVLAISIYIYIIVYKMKTFDLLFTSSNIAKQNFESGQFITPRF